jgi:Spy/CpxP family protein refolding chaperone
MKKLFIIGGILLLSAVIAYPVFARGQGWGGCNGYGQGRGQAYCPGYNGGGGNLSSEQRSNLEKLRYGFLGDTADLRNKIWAKKSEMDNLLNSTTLDEEKIRELNKEISALKTEMGDKRLSYELEAKKIAPEAGSYKGYGRGNPQRGESFGRGYGSGSCCN